MKNLTVVGSQWGDEGKGKIVDWLAEHVNIVVRFQGGHNAGHTIVIDDVTYKLSLLPSGIMRPELVSVIGNGVVINLSALDQEISLLRGQGVKVSPDNLVISENACLILPLHVELDQIRESMNSNSKIGTTQRGIGPAYEDKVGRRAIKMGHLQCDDLKSKVDNLTSYHNYLRKGMGVDLVDSDQVFQQLKDVSWKVQPYIKTSWQFLDKARRENKRILFEGAQGAMLDVDNGTYPYVTSSNTIAGQVSLGASVGPNQAGYVLGITKAYVTRVGEGPFPTEQRNEVGALLCERGHEIGTVTGRSRRSGWIDLVLLRQSIAISGINGLALTKMDILDVFSEIKICIGYELNGEKIDHIPFSTTEVEKVIPIYHTMPGWQSNTRGVRSWDDLPLAAHEFIQFIEKFTETPVVIISTSPERQDSILKYDFLGNSK